MRFQRALTLLLALSLSACPGSKPTTPLLPERDAGPNPTDGGHTSLTVETTSLSDAYLGDAYSAPLAVSGGSPPYAWSLSSGDLPSGLRLGAQGLLSGSPVASGSFTFTVHVQDASGAASSQQLTLSVLAPPTFSTASLSLGVVGLPYSAALSASGGLAPLSLHVTSGALPPGLQLEAFSLAGTPTTSGSFSFTLEARDANGHTASADFQLTIRDGLTITSTTLPDAYTDSAYGQAPSVLGGKAPYAWTLVSGALPPGLALLGSGVLDGTPSAAGTSTFSLRVTDANGATDMRELSLATYLPPLLAAVAPQSVYVQDNVARALQASQGKAPFVFSTPGPLPTGLSLAPEGLLHGQPTQGGAFTFDVIARDANGRTATRSVAFTVLALPTITTQALPDATLSTAYQHALTATGGRGTLTWTLVSGTLPPGLSLSPQGTLSGTPSSAGTSSFTVRVSDENGRTAPRTLALVVYAPPTITTSALPEADTGAPYSATLAVSGGKAPFSWSVVSGSLPTGLSLSSSGTISGTTTSSTRTFTIRVSDAQGRFAERSVSLSVYVPPTVTTDTLPQAISGQPYSTTLTASEGRAPLTWSHVGALPTGLTLSASGLISGTPTVQGITSFSASVQDAKGSSASRALSLTVSGSGQPFIVGHWNIEWFGAETQGPPNSTSPGGNLDDLQLAHARDILADTGANVWGLVEIVDNADFDVLKAQLPQYDGFLANDSTYVPNTSFWYSAGEQKPGILYDSSLVFQSAELILTENSNVFGGRPPLRVNFTTFINGASAPLIVIVMHMKAFADVESHGRRQEASIALKAYLDGMPTARVIVIGDWNDDVDRSITYSGGVYLNTPFENFISNPTHYTFITRALSERAERTTTEYPDTIDHTLVSDEVAAVYVPDSVRVVRPDSWIPNYNNIVSDHYPVVSHYAFGGGGGVPDGGTSTPPAMLINEVLANEPSVPSGDGGTVPDSQYEFVEVINTGGSTADLSGWSLSDANVVRHTFATGTLVPPGKAYAVFGGPNGFPPGTPDTVHASTGQLGLNNGGDTVTLRNLQNTAVDVMTYTSTVDNVSLNRSPDAFPGGTDFVLHTTLNPSLGSSPGRRANGNAF
ncbi:putative Ig domain-containing protein [Myxococcus sp. CA040A]|uniref:putative Ig domain-containing protein n=1 Tax=Myxococcus sp. CA040A TaxID=2741738 RepID=UPI00157B7E19|nr:putative Ig domain-containing protein [Myxococcus sp. CA040A]NTX07505.1 putative Ig domain-containing protein [Myxococcus sp. CA040A]